MAFVDSNTLNLNTLWTSARFEPALVQRDFQWTEAHIGQLVSDIRRAMAKGDPNYFIGTIVIRRLLDRMPVYDGLQRLTALTILFCLLRDMTQDPALAQRLARCVHAGDGSRRLLLPAADPALGTELVPAGEAVRRRTEKSLDTGAAIRVRLAARQARNQLRALDAEERDALALYLLERVYVIAIEADSEGLARQIFVTTNNRGLALSEVDVFKGQLADLAGPGEAAARVVGIWNELATGDPWFADFLKAIDFQERGAIYGSGNLLDLSEYLLATGATGEPLLHWMERLREQHAGWRLIQGAFGTPEGQVCDRALKSLSFVRFKEWQPLALAFVDAYRQSVSERALERLGERLTRLARHCVAFQLADTDPNSRAHIFRRALSELRNQKNPFNGALAPTVKQADRLRQALLGDQMSSENSLTLMRWLEVELSGDASIDHLDQPTSVEHVLPRNPEANSQWMWDFPDEEARYSACHALGNLCLLPWEFNDKALGNKDFADKKAEFETAGGRYRLSQFATARDVFANGRWTYAHIMDRSQVLRTTVMLKLDLPEPNR